MEAELEWDLKWVDSPEELGALVKDLLKEEVVSVDTETVGWNTGNERLCLIQLGLPSKELVAVVDPLALKDISPLAEPMSSTRPHLVAHNASFEEKQFARHGIKLRGVIDTLTLARRLRGDLPNHTLRTCAKLMLGLEISKEEQTSDWSKRPLSAEQLKYARLDAEIAYKLYAVLAEMDSKLEIDPAMKVPELMAELHQAVKDRFRLTKEIAPELALLWAREDLLRQTIRGKLIEGEPEYQGEHGRCKITRVKNTEINPILVKEQFPDLYPLVVSEKVEKDRMKAVMREHGIDEEDMNKVLEVIGYVDRMSLTIGELE